MGQNQRLKKKPTRKKEEHAKRRRYDTRVLIASVFLQTNRNDRQTNRATQTQTPLVDAVLTSSDFAEGTRVNERKGKKAKAESEETRKTPNGTVRFGSAPLRPPRRRLTAFTPTFSAASVSTRKRERFTASYFFDFFGHLQHSSAPFWNECWRLLMISRRDGSISGAAPVSANDDLDAITFAAVHLQHFCLSLTSQAGLAHCSSHLGRGQVVGLAHDHEHDVSSHRGAQLAFGAMQVV